MQLDPIVIVGIARTPSGKLLGQFRNLTAPQLGSIAMKAAIACALGHPIGASGASIIITLISALQQLSLKRGIASVCIGGGEVTAIAVEIAS